MSVQVEFPKGHPMRDAWETYSATDEYKNTRRWALTQAHVDGSLWAAFIAGYATAQPAVPSGWVLVPREATDEMISAGCNATNGYRVDVMRTWDAMLQVLPCQEMPQTPAAPSVPEGMARDLGIKADHAYVDYINQMRRPECLGWDHKVRTGKFTETELRAHMKAGELLGRHRALSEVAAMLAATPSHDQPEGSDND